MSDRVGPRPRSFGRRLARVVASLLLLVLIAAAVGALWFWSTARASLAQVDGEIRLAGLKAPVTAIRDAQGVPHITASTLEDLFFAQGYVTAQDRLWQMDISRRWAAGEVAEILGTPFLTHDREQRILGMRQVAERSVTAASDEEKSHFDAYSRGVNAYIESHTDNLPIEFRILRYRPKPWTAIDSILCGTNLAQSLSHYQYITQITRERVLAKLGPELAADLYPNSSWRDRPPGSIGVGFEVPTTTEEPEQDEEVQPRPPKKSPPRTKNKTSSLLPFNSDFPFESLDAAPPGSNNWVVSGSRTASGKPLLSNDMHLVNTIPNTWYEAHLTLQDGSFDVAGVTIPGLPYVIVGHNRRIAWGFTNLGPAVEDTYIETVNAKGEYQAGDGWHAMTKRHEEVRVKGDAEVKVEFDVMSTRHGPVITPLIPGETRTLTLRWTLFEQPFLNPFLAIDRAQNWQEFRAALATFNAPSQNAVYADVDGHIGYQATGQIPIRPEGDDASVPVPGNDDVHEWQGFVPFQELPSVFDPAAGMIATANGRIVPEGYAHTLSYEWGPPYRTERIYRLLGAKKKLTPADMLQIEMDVRSAYDQLCGDRFVYAVDHAASATARARAAAQIMRGWDGNVAVDSRAAQMVASVRRELWRMLLEPRLGATDNGVNTLTPRIGRGWAVYNWFMSSVAMESILSHRPQRWLPQGFANYDDLIAAAVDRAAGETQAQQNWGQIHRIELRHPVFGQLPMVGRWFGTGPHPLAGDGTTVKQISGSVGPSERLTVDFSDLDKSTLNVVTGQSGQIFSPHFMDQWNAWYSGTTFALPFTEGAVKRAAQHTLTLQPR